MTIQFVPTEQDGDDPYGEAIAFIDGLSPGGVAVIATGGSTRTAVWGELFSAAAVGREAAGVVTDGYVRDSPKIKRLGFAAFAAGTRPLDFRGRMVVADRGQVVECGGVRVVPGDLVVGDDDGVVVVPRAVEAEVMARAGVRAQAESSVREELLAGRSLRSVWDIHHVL